MEARYEVWRRLPEGAPRIARDDLDVRVEECTGVSKAPAERSPEEGQRLADTVTDTGVPERTRAPRLNFATNTFSDMVNERLDGSDPFSNEGTVYAKTSDDAALNAGVIRFAVEPQAARRLRNYPGLTGQVVLPTITMHGANDPTGFATHQERCRESGGCEQRRPSGPDHHGRAHAFEASG